MHLMTVATACAVLSFRAVVFGGVLLLTSQTAAAPTLDDAKPMRADARGGSGW